MGVRRLMYVRCLHDQVTVFQKRPIIAAWRSKPFLDYSHFTIFIKMVDTSIGITRIDDAESSLFAPASIVLQNCK